MFKDKWLLINLFKTREKTRVMGNNCFEIGLITKSTFECRNSTKRLSCAYHSISIKSDIGTDIIFNEIWLRDILGQLMSVLHSFITCVCCFVPIIHVCNFLARFYFDHVVSFAWIEPNIISIYILRMNWGSIKSVRNNNKVSMTSHDHWDTEVQFVSNNISMIKNYRDQLFTTWVKIVSKWSTWTKLFHFSTFDSSLFKSLFFLACFGCSFNEFIGMFMSKNLAFELRLISWIEH